MDANAFSSAQAALPQAALPQAALLQRTYGTYNCMVSLWHHLVMSAFDAAYMLSVSNTTVHDSFVVKTINDCLSSLDSMTTKFIQTIDGKDDGGRELSRIVFASNTYIQDALDSVFEQLLKANTDNQPQ